MLVRNFLPTPLLQGYVRFFGIVHLEFPPGVRIPQKPFSPRPENLLCFFPKDPEYIAYPGSDLQIKRPSILLQGQHTFTNTRCPGQEFLAFVVHFQPGVLYRLTGVPLWELNNTYADAELFLPKDIRFVNERLNDCRSYPDMISVVEAFLVKLLQQTKKAAHGVDAAAQFLLLNTERTSIDWLARETCLCTKQFERKFKERTGVTASTLARINRFDKTVKLKNANPGMDWLSIALHGGYHDYQHLVRDYKDFTGLTPTAYLKLDTNAPESLFGLHEENTLYAK